MREFIRHPSSIPVQLVQQGGDINPGTNTLNNVSFGGVSCLCSEPVDKGSSVKMTIACIDPSFEISGVAVWCKPNHNLYEVGVEFIVSKDKLFLLRMIEQICHIEHYRNEVLHEEGRQLDSEEAAKEWIEKHAENFPEM
ncbi:MAG: PilZ domain-containing protein [Proteobacteria bacterium]|nr:PilZ domain-containing protein [Pseudomonadota bacterium]NOG60612.1 PilZ domain-containing protein [Pseudomonadota bacterium]